MYLHTPPQYEFPGKTAVTVEAHGIGKGYVQLLRKESDQPLFQSLLVKLLEGIPHSFLNLPDLFEDELRAYRPLADG